MKFHNRAGRVSAMNNKGNDYTQLLNCLACGGVSIESVLSLGEQPLANDLKVNPEIYESYPLELKLCTDCFHSQLSIAVNQELLFSNYIYESGTSQTLQDYFSYFTQKYINPLGKNLKIMEIASNDGSFLKIAKQSGHRAIGVDPASNLLSKALVNSVVTVNAYWPNQISEFITPDIDVFVAMNVLAHVKNPLFFLESCKKLLSQNGVILIQTSQAKMIELGQFDTIYHEHLSFFNTKSMSTLANRAGLKLTNVEYEDIHGISYVWVLAKEEKQVPVFSNKVQNLNVINRHESDIGLFQSNIYKKFATDSINMITQIKKSLVSHRENGYQIIGYGVAAKGNTVIQYGKLELDCMIDDSPVKQGLSIPKVGTKIYSSDLLSEINKPICFLIPAWNFKEEIVRKIRSKRSPQYQKLDRLIVYFPEFSEMGL